METLAQALIEKGFKGRYLGCDFSQGLIDEAQKKVGSIQKTSDISIDFKHADISQAGWTKEIPNNPWEIISAFAVLHHIPSRRQRITLCKKISTLLLPNGKFYISAWQLKNSPRLFARVKPWQTVGIQDKQVEEGDVLMDWRADQNQDQSSQALRYVHIFSESELEQLARDANFEISQTFYSDGKEGNLALYQAWLIK